MRQFRHAFSPALRICQLAAWRSSSRKAPGLHQGERGERQVVAPAKLAESQCEQSNTGDGDSEQEAVANDLVTHDGTYKSVQRLASCDVPAAVLCIVRSRVRTGLMNSLNRGEQM